MKIFKRISLLLVVVQMTNGSLDDKKLDDRGIILDDRGGMFDDRQHDRRMRRSEKGPPVASVSVLRIVAISGEEVRVSCPIDGTPTPIIEWRKNGDVIDHTWTRMKTLKRVLKIRHIESADTGVYTCRGVNGFGSVTVRAEIIVKDHDEEKIPKQEYTIAKPVFTENTQKLLSFYKKVPGSQFSLDCESLGVPPPNISWFHNKVLLSSNSLLKIQSVQESDSGLYTCIATNTAGQASRQFSLTVETPKVELPLIERFPNTSVSLGKSATLVCEVRSNLTPEIQWLRRTTDSQFSISIGDMLLVHAGEGQIERQGQNMYTSTLAIPAVVEGNSGLYVCLATNSAGGFNFKTAELSITNPLDNKTPPLVLYLVIGLAALVLILLFIIFLCLLRGRHKSFRDYRSHSTLIYQTNPSVYKQKCSSQYNTAPSGHSGHKAHVVEVTKPNIYDVPYSHTTKYSPVSLSEGGGSRTNSLQMSYNASSSSRTPSRLIAINNKDKQYTKRYPDL
ncbi:fibroblast growth factor receptor-like 1 [Eurytemora carolleeae]|uniref:fibroblast growth factor receptor-like 1 n=1 Tax=Eurytemora carolleeae TaxID=1294199 RepID=UPI000C757C09|nr:fibroblast growth factor receptor-like 1 [Eurytemora carolleeae]|eukprot:XP_023330620.1 fibroblast growth factor receptor-like 1 [Eurytemora affinis]